MPQNRRSPCACLGGDCDGDKSSQDPDPSPPLDSGADVGMLSLPADCEAPPPRRFAQMAYFHFPWPRAYTASDGEERFVERGFVVLGGETMSGLPLNDMWLFDLPRLTLPDDLACPWTRLSTNATTTFGISRGFLSYSFLSHGFALRGGRIALDQWGDAWTMNTSTTASSQPGWSVGILPGTTRTEAVVEHVGDPWCTNAYWSCLCPDPNGCKSPDEAITVSYGHSLELAVRQSGRRPAVRRVLRGVWALVGSTGHRLHLGGVVRSLLRSRLPRATELLAGVPGGSAMRRWRSGGPGRAPGGPIRPGRSDVSGHCVRSDDEHCLGAGWLRGLPRSGLHPAARSRLGCRLHLPRRGGECIQPPLPHHDRRVGDRPRATAAMDADAWRHRGRGAQRGRRSARGPLRPVHQAVAWSRRQRV